MLGGFRYESARDYVAGNGDGFARFKYGGQNASDDPVNSVMPPPNMPLPAGTEGTNVLIRDLNKRMQDAQGKKYRTNDNPVWKAGSTQVRRRRLQIPSSAPIVHMSTNNLSLTFLINF